METIKQLYGAVKNFLVTPKNLILLGAIALAAIIVIGVFVLLKRMFFSSRLRKVVQEPDQLEPLITKKFSSRSLLKKSGLITSFVKKNGSNIVRIIGIDQLWVQRLVSRRRRSDFKRLLKYAPDRGLFKCFLVSLEKKRFAPSLLKWLADSKNYLAMRQLAESGRGEDFSGRAAHAIFKHSLPQIREMTGDPEWPSRYFAVKILLRDSDDRSQRAIWDAIGDPYPLIRMTVAKEFAPKERDKLYAELKALFLSDPSFEVRNTAWERIQADFSNLYSLEPKSLSGAEAYHAMELLRTNSKSDENLALTFLDGDNLELRFVASRFLEKSGTLERLCLEVDFGNQEGLQRNADLLRKASEVNITSFLAVTERTHNPATLLVCMQILQETGDRALITDIAKKVYRQFDGSLESMQIYKTTLNAIFKRGNDEALKLLDRELVRRRHSKELLELILSSLPGRNDVFLDTIYMFLKDPEFSAKSTLREAMLRMPIALVLPEIFTIIKGGREQYPHAVRIQAFTLLGEMQMPYCLQTLLENLPILPLQEAREFAKILALYPREFFVERVENLLSSTDSQIRASLISVLPFTEEKDFLPSIRRSVKDADPGVRISSVWALVEFGDTRSVNQAVSMLRDPVERVRRQAAQALGSHGSDNVLANLEEILQDANDVASVKAAAIHGLAQSKSLKSIDILAGRLENEEDLVEELVTGLHLKQDKKEVAYLIDNFKDASQKVRSRISVAFSKMKEKGEQTLVDLLREDIASLKPFIAEVLEITGFVESTIRRLKHREVNVRRNSAEFLSLIGTEAAFRGMVLAARDPDEEVRVSVVKALEKLETEEGKHILDALKSDPDKRIRKYTHWALQRLKAKSL